MLRLFKQATLEFGIPSRVRSDKGGENILVCYYNIMVSYRGPGRKSHIAGSSHNQRIERMWRDVYRCVACMFHEVFYFLEARELLDPDDEHDLFVLHNVFLRVINHHLQMFVRAWNQHPLRTERNWPPHKIWMNGMMDPERRHLTAVRDVVDDVPEIPSPPLPDSAVEYFMQQSNNVNIDDAISEYVVKWDHLICREDI